MLGVSVLQRRLQEDVLQWIYKTYVDAHVSGVCTTERDQPVLDDFINAGLIHRDHPYEAGYQLTNSTQVYLIKKRERAHTRSGFRGKRPITTSAQEGDSAPCWPQMLMLGK